MGRTWIYVEYESETQEEKDHSENLDVGRRIILK
jgi:hypothetical protein